MTKKIAISIADNVYNQIEKYKTPNRSEFVEEMIRIGLQEYLKDTKSERRKNK